MAAARPPLVADLTAALVQSIDAGAPSSTAHVALKRVAAALMMPHPRLADAEVGRATATRAGERGTELLRVLASRPWGTRMARVLLALAPNASRPTAARLQRDHAAKKCLYALQASHQQQQQLRQPPSDSSSLRAAASLAPLVYTGQLAGRLRAVAAVLTQSAELGLVSQRLGHGVLQELDDFDRFVATLESEAVRSDWSSPPERIAAWTRPMTRRLEMLCEMVEACRGMRGGALVATLQSYLDHGSEEYCAMAQRLLSEAWPPLARMCADWALKGVLDDVHAEFFVGEHGQLVDHMLFVDESVARRVQGMGSAMQVLRARRSGAGARLVDDAWVAEVLKATATEPSGFVRALLGNSESKANAAVISYMWGDVHLMDHLVALKRFFLHAQGDFFRHLIDQVQDSLRLPLDTLSPNDFTGQLEHALMASNAKMSPEYVLSRLDVAFIESPQGVLGWDGFALVYRVEDRPLNLILDPLTLQRYGEVFAFLWRLRRALHSLEITWFEHAAQTRAARELQRAVFVVLHRCHLLRAEMVHFASNLLSYVMFEVVETSWDQLKSDLSAAEDLASLVEAHQAYLRNVLLKALIVDATKAVGVNASQQLADETRGLASRVELVFRIILRFCAVQDELLARIEQEAGAWALRRRRAAYEDKQARWGLKEGSSSSFGDWQAAEKVEAKALSSEFAPQVDRLTGEYAAAMADLVHRLGECASENLRLLSLRLDFNLYYSQRG